MATNMLSSLSLSGQFSRMIGAFANSCFHAARDGNFSWSISFRAETPSSCSFPSFRSTPSQIDDETCNQIDQVQAITAYEKSLIILKVTDVLNNLYFLSSIDHSSVPL
ncbi:hypothetical protein OIU74_002729 [Salix koriyanagi]|uniref:Uncharacterized protein n=1 Tax=Salix koriyanagi TaxID=2511006 RepID=A0A9Q1APM7_9ROSI|nr:hypothetical protein OIU74_002729 [Salix koriyanagi]